MSLPGGQYEPPGGLVVSMSLPGGHYEPPLVVTMSLLGSFGGQHEPLKGFGGQHEPPWWSL